MAESEELLDPEERREELTRAPKSSPEDADPRITVSKGKRGAKRIDVADTAPCRLKSTGTRLRKSALRDTPVTFAASTDRAMPVTVIGSLASSDAEPLPDELPKVADRPVTTPLLSAAPPAAEASNVTEMAPLKVAWLVPPPVRLTPASLPE